MNNDFIYFGKKIKYGDSGRLRSSVISELQKNKNDMAETIRCLSDDCETDLFQNPAANVHG